MKKIIHLLAAASIAAVFSNCAFGGDDEIIGSKVAENVRVLTPVEARYIVTPEQTRLTFEKVNDPVAELQPGDIIVSDVNGASPSGYLKKVTQISETSDTRLVDTVPATLTDAIQEGQATASGSLNPAGDNSLLKGATYNPETGLIEEINPAPGVTVFGTKKPNDAVPECSTKKWYVKFDNVNIQDAGHINGCVGMNLDFVMNVKIKWFEMKSAEFSVNPSITSKIDVSVGGATFKISRAQVTLTTFNLQPITFMIGPVPVVIIPRIKIVLGVDGKVTATLVTSLQFAASAKAGLQYKDKKWKTIKEKSSNFVIDTPQFGGEVDAMVYAGPEITFLLYGVVGPGANLYVYTHFIGNWSPVTQQLQKWEVWLGFEAGAHFTAEAFGRTLFNISEPSIIGYEGLIASSDYGGIAPAGTGRVVGVVGQRISGQYQKSDGTYSPAISGDFVTVGNLVGKLGNK